MEKGLNGVGYRDMIIALRFDSNYARQGKMPFLAPQVYSILREQALANIEHDPNDPDMLGILMKFQLRGIKLEQAPDRATWEEYLHRKIAYSPYNAELWSDYASMISVRREQEEEISQEALIRRDDYYTNSVVYSNFKTEYLYSFGENVFKRLLEQFPTLELKKDALRLSKSEISEINENIICPFIRIDRVLDAICSAEKDGAFCDSGPGMGVYHKMIYQFAYDHKTCQQELDSSIEELMFTPVEFDWAQYPFH